ncbi:MAG: DNA alkylation repair protein [Gemmatimonadota bacterium]|nr:MAG: DNA alkylation repair protein [Gemmatimonadota bacterium]
MNYSEVMKRLKTLGTEQNRKIYQRHGAGDKTFGVSFANLSTLKKQINTDHDLASELWASGNTDAQTLATMIANPEKMNKSELDKWLKDIHYYMLIDVFVAHLVSKSPHAQSRMEKWTKSKDEWVGRAGWQLLAQLAMKKNELPDIYFEEYLKTIRKSIHGSRNRTKDAMNNALIAIGMRNSTLEKRALAVAADIGKIDVDHGVTSCKTPDAVSYIKKVKKRKKGRKR